MIILRKNTGTQRYETSKRFKMKKYAIALQAGAEDMEREQVSQEQDKQYRQGVQHALEAGKAVLEKGGSAVDAVVAAVSSMEDNPYFNAGKGSNLNIHGETAFDAALMEGKELRLGAIGGVRYVRNPIRLAQALMLNEKYCFLSGSGAEEYALSHDIPFEKPSYFVTEAQQKRWQKKTGEMAGQHDTVGAVALDQDGNLAAATSTGGLFYSLKGRISDSPIAGAGTYAHNKHCAVSCTGVGEEIMRSVLAHEVYALMKYTHASIKEASEKAVQMHKDLLKGGKGLVALDPEGNIACAFDTNFMRRGYLVEGSAPVIALWKEEGATGEV
ncbi:beta-aspartyl-peptidase (threonine type) [Pontibacter ummariensis]|uniref:Isoaspartyl peptidase n=1 Tax=Pontibacter ummariensis TaxID=1610492 RepID=A0A239LHR9_9BACT|nr:isoaspartyl peptidase/L-asparaginase [Pontibacter ummariensis]PRY03384.1 beta-aspartyl-peptidase (threonine type) [Pontibacter ummariensis]SNT29209.1 beta-aspartyl-peptidase (threonine type) [Pontibacter ummariensis]